MSKVTTVSELPDCDFCGKPATYDARTKLGPWANMCSTCYVRYGIRLGTGFGQKLELIKQKKGKKDVE